MILLRGGGRERERNYFCSRFISVRIFERVFKDTPVHDSDKYKP